MSRPCGQKSSQSRDCLILLIGCFLLLHFSSARAEQIEDGIAAANRGDSSTALRILLPLAEEGNPMAQFSLGDMYFSGKGLPMDCLGAVKWYRKVVEQRYVQAEYDLGLAYYCGGEKKTNSPHNYPAAIEAFQHAAARGEARAMNMVAFMYEKGTGIQQDYTEAAKWYLKAAEKGDAEAQETLGEMYEKGSGVLQDYVHAYMWYNLAALDDVMGRMAQIERDDIAAKMIPAQIAEAQELSRKWRPQ